MSGEIFLSCKIGHSRDTTVLKKPCRLKTIVSLSSLFFVHLIEALHVKGQREKGHNSTRNVKF